MPDKRANRKLSRWPVTNRELLQDAPQLSKSDRQTSALQRFCTVVLFSPSDQLPRRFPSSKVNRDRPKFCPLSTFLFEVSRQPATHAQPLNLNTSGRQQLQFVAPLFSWSYELLFPQLYCFQNLLRCPRGVPPESHPRKEKMNHQIANSSSINNSARCAHRFPNSKRCR